MDYSNVSVFFTRIYRVFLARIRRGSKSVWYDRLSTEGGCDGDSDDLVDEERRREYLMNMVEIQQRGIEFLRSVQKVGTSYRALGLAERSSTDTPLVPHR